MGSIDGRITFYPETSISAQTTYRLRRVIDHLFGVDGERRNLYYAKNPLIEPHFELCGVITVFRMI